MPDTELLKLRNLFHFTGPLPASVISVIETGLRSWDKKTGVPSRIVGHNKNHPLAVAPAFNRDMCGVAPMDHGRGAQFLVAPGKSPGRTTLFVFQMEPPFVPRVTKVEVSLRYLLKGAPDLRGSHTIYLHALVVPNEGDYVYYGITSRRPYIRFREHQAAAKQGSHLLFHAALRDHLPRATQVNHCFLGAGLTLEQAQDSEEYLVDTYSLNPNHANGLNMIPGGREGISQMHKLGVVRVNQTFSPEERDDLLIRYLAEHPRKGIPNPLISRRWVDDAYAEAVICGRENRLSASQVREIRGLAALGTLPEDIVVAAGARNLVQVHNVLRGRTYNRIRQLSGNSASRIDLGTG